MEKTLDVLGIISGMGFLTGGTIFLYLWYRDREHPHQKKLGYGFIAVGAVLILARFLGLFK